MSYITIEYMDNTEKTINTYLLNVFYWIIQNAIREAYPDEGFEYSFFDTDKSIKDLFEDLMTWGDDGLLHDFKFLIESVKLGYCDNTQHLMRYIDCNGESQYRDYQSFLNEMANPNEFYFWEHCIPTMLKVIRRGVWLWYLAKMNIIL